MTLIDNSKKLKLQPYCNKCGTTEPKFEYAKNNAKFWWVTVPEKSDSIITTFIDPNGNLFSGFQIIFSKEFDWNEKLTLLCPKCALELLMDFESSPPEIF